MPQISRARALVYALAVLALLVVAGQFVLRKSDGHAARASVAGAGSEAHALHASHAPARRLYVHVAGAVQRPGLYRLRDGSRVQDAVDRAGGAKPKADLSLVNLAAPVVDGQQVLVPTRGQAQAAVGTSGATPGAGLVVKVHLNSATLEQLDVLPGIGPVTAQKILDYRTEHGAFTSVGELDSVSGIGPATMEELKPLVDL